MRTLFFIAATGILLGQPYNGTTTGTVAYSAGKFGNGATVNGTNYITVPAGATNFSGASWTVEAWAKLDTLGAAVAISNGTGTGSTALTMGAQGTGAGSVNAQIGTGFGNGPSMAVSTWQHIAVVCDSGTTVRAYLAGTQYYTASATCGTPNLPLIFGWDGANGWKPWVGMIDEVAMWDTAKYTSNFTPPTVEYVGNEANLRALYHLSDATDSATTSGGALTAGTLSPVLGLILTAATGGTSPYSYQLQSYSGSCASGTFANDGAALTGQTSSAVFARADGATRCYRVIVTDAASGSTNSNSVTAPLSSSVTRVY